MWWGICLWSCTVCMCRVMETAMFMRTVWLLKVYRVVPHQDNQLLHQGHWGSTFSLLLISQYLCVINLVSSPALPISCSRTQHDWAEIQLWSSLNWEYICVEEICIFFEGKEENRKGIRIEQIIERYAYRDEATKEGWRSFQVNATIVRWSPCVPWQFFFYLY